MKSALFFVLLALVTATAQAADETKPFLRKATVTLLRYDPEQSIAAQCETRANTARLMRVGLLKKQDFENRLLTHLKIAGLTGAAREICTATKTPEALPPFIRPAETLSLAGCKAASALVRGKFKDITNDQIEKGHPDLTAGYLQGAADTLSPFPAACETYPQEWAALSADVLLMTRQAAYTRAQRPCSLWRRAFYDELRKASAIAKTKGRAAGLSYLQLYPMLAYSGTKHYCTDAIGTSVQLAALEVTRLEIESMAKE